jgi:hypothetical protein
VIGPLVGGFEAAEAVEATLLAWLPSVLAEVNAAKGLHLKVPTVIDMPITVDALTAAATPAMAVAGSGLAGEPVRDGRGRYSAAYSITVRVLERAGGYRATARAVHAYSVAVRTALIQHRSLGGIARSVEWSAEEYSVIDPDKVRTLAGVDVGFIVTLPYVLDERLAPSGSPPASPDLITPDRPTVTSVDVTAIPQEA